MRIDVHYYYRQEGNHRRSAARLRFRVLIFLIGFVLGACDRKNEDILIVPPVTPPLSRQLIGYGVINVSYTHVIDDPESAGPSLGYLRRGSIVKIVERRPVIKRTVGNQENRTAEGAVESWVLVEGNFRGWLTETVVDIYDNESQARTASESITQ
jgi:hypothetical protein